VSRLSQDYSSYTQVSKTLSNYTPQNAPGAGKVQTLLSGAPKQTAGWKATGQSYQSKIAQLVTEANTIAAQAEKAHC
jgi:hypothetical protein